MSLPVAILAGGLGARMGDLTKSQPKCLLEVAGRPFAEHQVELLKRNGLCRVVFCLGYLGEVVREALGDGGRLGVRIDYSFDGLTPLGTGGGLRAALPLLGDMFFVMYGDSYLNCDFAAVEETFRASGKLGLMTVFRNAGRWDRSNVVFRDGAIHFYDKRTALPEMEYIDYGLGALRAEALHPYAHGEFLDLASVYQDLLSRDQLAGHEIRDRFYEIGSMSGLAETREFFARRQSLQQEGS